MTGAGVLVYTLESAQIDNDIDQQIDQEIAEFRQLERGTDPQTQQPFASVDSLLDLYLDRNVTDDDEMLVAYAPSGAQRSPNRFGEAILEEPGYDAVLTELRTTGGTAVYDSPRYREVWVTLLPVENAADPTGDGALVIVNFLDDERSELDRTLRTYAVITVLSLVLITFLALWQSGRLLAPLRTLRAAASDITASDLSRRIPEQGNDDITALTRTVNGMLDRLEDGFEGQRRFIDDAGHELRTPLTVLRGHLELLDAASPEDVDQTRELLLDEVDRMARLVGDLILLAKSSRPDFVRPVPVDLGGLTATVLAKARGLGDRRWVADSTASGTVVVDEQRITQALLQLCDNAVKHTGPGDTVALGSSYGVDAVRLWVRDTGPGVPVADRAKVFERFGRSAMPEDDEGFGLGLSIVAAIAAAHEGRVHVEDPVPPGARFVITLPTGRPSTVGAATVSTAEEDPWPAS
ncbi:HAMP domain-containing sensor histidine kinase [uncultured Nocardioides sp.]|uniref:sensor histidine kinase n=1 Tax=uncultured Nocardioides sp. TaxID=198441 RepID=UPI0025F0ACDF|nr:HAMP domain-containing sensor histidine kinase [uncultured Nocardioides sp.]